MDKGLCEWRVVSGGDELLLPVHTDLRPEHEVSLGRWAGPGPHGLWRPSEDFGL